MTITILYFFYIDVQTQIKYRFMFGWKRLMGFYSFSAKNKIKLMQRTNMFSSILWSKHSFMVTGELF